MADTVWKITPDKAGKYTLATADKYVDRDIEFDLAQAELSVGGEAEATINNVTVGLKSQNQYSISGEGNLSGTASSEVTQAGYISDGATGAISGSATLNAKIPAAVLTTTGGTASANLTSVNIGTRADSKYPITGSGSISGSFGAAVQTEGYARGETASGSISGNVNLNAEIPAIKLQSSGTANASIDSVTVGNKSGSNYPVTGSASITGESIGSVQEAGYGTNESANGTVSGTASLSVTLPAITLNASGSGSATIDSVSVAADATSGKFKVSGSKAITGSASASIASAGYGKDETGSGSVSGTATVNALISASVLDNKAATGVTYTENTSVVIPSEGALYISEGYIPATYITLDQMLDGKADTAGTAEADLRTGKVAYDVNGKKLTGSMGNATITGGAISHTLGVPTYNSTSGKFDQSCDITTAAPSVNSAGYISSSEGTKNASAAVSENHALNKITGSIAISGTRTVKPVISKQSISISGVTDAADAAATTTAPSSGVYVKVNSAAATNNVNAAATISADGYGTNANHGIAGSGNVAVGASASDDTYIKIKEGSAKVNDNNSLSITAGNPTLNSGTGKYDISLSTSGTVSGSVATEGWIKSVTSGSVSGSGTKSLNAAALTHDNTATETKVSVGVSGARSSNLAAPGSDTTYYVEVSGSQSAAGSVTHSASVSEGYVPTAGLSQSATIPTSANITGSGSKVYLKSTAITNSLASAISSGYTLSLLESAPSAPYVTLTSNTSATTGAVYNGTSAGVSKYMKVYAGEYTVV